MKFRWAHTMSSSTAFCTLRITASLTFLVRLVHVQLVKFAWFFVLFLPGTVAMLVLHHGRHDLRVVLGLDLPHGLRLSGSINCFRLSGINGAPRNKSPKEKPPCVLLVAGGAVSAWLHKGSRYGLF